MFKPVVLPHLTIVFICNGLAVEVVIILKYLGANSVLVCATFLCQIYMNVVYVLPATIRECSVI